MINRNQKETMSYALPCSLALTFSRELEQMCLEARAMERDVKSALETCDEEALLRSIAAGSVPSARELVQEESLTLEQFWWYCLALKGEPWSEAPMRRDMRERVRVWRHAARQGARVPRSRDELLALWSEASEGEFPLYRGTETARFRTEGIPFAHGRVPFEAAPLPPGAQTTAPEEIPVEVDRLLALVANESLALEARAAAAYFAHGAIHPFRDGNGHCGRLLSCAMLADAYSPAALLALTAQLQSRRRELGAEIRAAVGGKKDAERFCRLFLGLFVQGQWDVLDVIGPER